MDNREILLVGFGDLSGLEDDFRKTFGGRRVTSAKTAAQGLADSDDVFVQPVYLLPGFEYDRLRAEAAASGKNTTVGEPLLCSEENITSLAAFLYAQYGQSPTLFAGHGSCHPQGAAVYRKLQGALRKAGFAGAFLGVLEGEPGFDTVVGEVKQAGISSVTLAPLTLTAGKHVREDIFGGEPTSWINSLCAAGVAAIPAPGTLLDFAEVRRMFVERCQSDIHARV